MTHVYYRRECRLKPEPLTRGLTTALLRLALVLGVFLALATSPREAAAQANWAPNVTYAVNGQVKYNNIVYACVQGHTSQTGWEPPQVPALWQRPIPPPTPVPDWAPATSYPLGFRVLYYDAVYEARQSHTSQVGWEPPRVPALWQRPAENATRDWVYQKVYRAGDFATENGNPFRSRYDHLSTLDGNPSRNLATWEKVDVLASCSGKPDGTMCNRGFVRPNSLDGSPVARCQAQRCVRSNVPDVVHAFPWTSTAPIYVSTVDELRTALAQVEKEPKRQFNIFVAPGDYVVNAPLTLRDGSVIVEGDVQNPASVVFMRTLPTRIWEVHSPEGNPRTLLALRGVKIKGGSADGPTGGGAGILAARSALIVQDSIIEGNDAQGGTGSGIHSFEGFLWVENSLIEGNGSTGTCAGVSAGGGIAARSNEEAYILRSTVRGNKNCRGGGIYASYGNVLIEQSTITENQASTFGAGIGVLQGKIHLKLNTVANNSSGFLHASSNYPTFGAGLALYGFGGKNDEVSLLGNILAGNLTRKSSTFSDDFRAFFDFSSEATALPIKRARLNNIKNWSMMKSPADLKIDSTLVNKDPKLGLLGGTPRPFYLPGTPSDIHRKYSPDGQDPKTAIPATDQRGYVRPSVTTTTPGSIDPDAAPL
jgi:hypothetical protein